MVRFIAFQRCLTRGGGGLHWVEMAQNKDFLQAHKTAFRGLRILINWLWSKLGPKISKVPVMCKYVLWLKLVLLPLAQLTEMLFWFCGKLPISQCSLDVKTTVLFRSVKVLPSLFPICLLWMYFKTWLIHQSVENGSIYCTFHRWSTVEDDPIINFLWQKIVAVLNPTYVSLLDQHHRETF